MKALILLICLTAVTRTTSFIEICLPTQYMDMNVHMCADCPTGCASCVQLPLVGCTVDCPLQVYCTSCQTGFAPNNSACVECSTLSPPSYYDESLQDCVSCPTSCTACTSSTSCTGCQVGYGLSGAGGVCATLCAPNEFWNSETSQCTKCLDNCLTCTGLDTCTTCLPPWTLTGGICHCGNKDIKPNARCTLCPDGFFCRACTVSGQTPICLSCNVNHNRALASDGSCACRYGYAQINQGDMICNPIL